MFVPDWLKTNAYRVLRLSANANASEIHKAASNVRRAAALGLTRPAEDDMTHWGEIPHTEADIRSAIGRLENPKRRLSDRLFWFHLRTEQKGPTSEGGQDAAARGHDAILHQLFAAFDASLDSTGISLWIGALRAWHQVVCYDDYWAFIIALEERGAFEPAALPSEIIDLRAVAVELAAEPIVVTARDAFARGDLLTTSRILAALGDLADTGSWAALAQEDIASPAAERVRTLCGAVRQELSSKIIREQDAGKKNLSVCEAALKRFRSEIEPALQCVIQLLPQDHESVLHSREQAALCLAGIASDYTWADNYIVSEKLYEEAHSLAKDTLGAIRIEPLLARAREQARTQRLRGDPISAAPSLYTINGFGMTLYGNSDFDHVTGSYSTTHYFVALFVPIFPVGRYRVINKGNGHFSFVGKLPLRNLDRWHLGIAAAAIVAIILYAMNGSGQSSNYTTTPSTSIDASSSSTTPGTGNANLEPPPLSPSSEEVPPVGTGNSLGYAQIKYCVAEDIRLSAAKNAVSADIGDDVDRFNAMVADYNSRCSNYRYQRGMLENVKSDVERNREALEAEGRNRFSKALNTEGLGIGSPNVPNQDSQTVAPESPPRSQNYASPNNSNPTSQPAQGVTPPSDLPPPLTQPEAAQIDTAERRENFKTCITGTYPSLCKHPMLAPEEAVQVAAAERRENFKTCITGTYPSLCKHPMLTPEEAVQVAAAERRENFKTCITGTYPSLCKHPMLTPEEAVQVDVAERRENFKTCITGTYPSLCKHSLLNPQEAVQVGAAERR